MKPVPSNLNFEAPPARRWAAFTLVEILVAMALLSLIVLALMTVFDSTQKAFRAGITQTDVLESGRATMDLIRSDLESMTPSLAPSNVVVSPFNGGSISNNVNFCVTVTNYTSPMSPFFQSLVGSNEQRTNLLENFFILSRGNVNGSPSWIGSGYVVDTNSSDGGLYPLYRFYQTTNVITGTPASLYNDFASTSLTNSPPWSHLMDGVVHLRVRAFDTSGAWLNRQNFKNGQVTNKNIQYLILQSGEGGLYMLSNTIPASVEVEMGVLEDRTLQHAESILTPAAQMTYLSNHVGQVHIFRQRVPIRNVDRTAYQ